MIGYFQLFAEPYVMTQGGPLEHDARVVLLMYEEGFRWWRMGIGAAIAFVLLRDHARSCDARSQLPASQRAERAMRRAEALAGSSALHAALVAGAVAHAHAARSGWSRRRSCRAGEASTLPPPLLPRAPTLEHYVDALHAARPRRAHFCNSALVAVLATVGLAARSTRWPATPSPSCASAAATALFRVLSRRS